MCKREGIFFGVIFLFLLILLFSVIFLFFGYNFLKEYGPYFSPIMILLLTIAILPRTFSKKYNNWLESDLITTKPELTLKEIRLMKLKVINKKSK